MIAEDQIKMSTGTSVTLSPDQVRSRLAELNTLLTERKETLEAAKAAVKEAEGFIETLRRKICLHPNLKDKGGYAYAIIACPDCKYRDIDL